MIDVNVIKNIYLIQGSTDLRKGIDGYASIIQNNFELSPFDSSLYLFCNKDHNKIKCLYFDGNGFWLLYKRLEKKTFKWIKGDESIVITKQQLRWLFEGLKIEQKQAFKEEIYKYV
ncbi:MAG: IS66 family insertion sequence element accessory protein TnpB [Cellulosilyticaceae bacterium]